MPKAAAFVDTPTCKVPLRTINLFVLDNLCVSAAGGGKSVTEVAERLVGLHAKRPQTPYLSLYARVPGFSPADLDAALYRDRTLLRAHCMRGTVHMLPLSQYRTVLEATAGQLDGMYRRAFDGLDGKSEIERSVLGLIRDRGPMTRAELAEALPMEVDERDLYRLVNELCTRGVLVKSGVSGPWRSSVYYYELLDRWQPSIPLGCGDMAAARAELLSWYLAAYAPATLKDISWWSGLSQAQVKKALAESERPIRAVRFEALEDEALIYADEFERLQSWEPPREPQVTLLPSFDPYVIAYIDRGRYINGKFYERVFKGVAGIIEPVVLVDGRIVGVWKYTAAAGALPVELFAGESKSSVGKPIERAAEEVAHFMRRADEETGGGAAVVDEAE
jgi:hypothetical protein